MKWPTPVENRQLAWTHLKQLAQETTNSPMLSDEIDQQDPATQKEHETRDERAAGRQEGMVQAVNRIVAVLLGEKPSSDELENLSKTE